VLGLAPSLPGAPWRNTYGIWRDELEPLGLVDLLGIQWSDCSAYTVDGELPLGRAYGLFDNHKLQEYLLARCRRAQVDWQAAQADQVSHQAAFSLVKTQAGEKIQARLVLDASGHTAAFIQRPAAAALAYQAAYGIVGRFSKPPVRPGQLVLMDYRSSHLDPHQLKEPPTFLYAMDLGDERYFVEETSLANAPAVGLDVLGQRLQQRLDHMGIQVTARQQIEHVLFPMNLPLPYLDQPVLGYGAAASMVHPASGYLLGAVLRRAQDVAQAVVHAMGNVQAAPMDIAHIGWRTLWPAERVRQRALYLFGLKSLMGLSEPGLQGFFTTFFRLPQPLWQGYLSGNLNLPGLLKSMLALFHRAPPHLRRYLAASILKPD
jgi:lycopene beta-cyclase